MSINDPKPWTAPDGYRLVWDPFSNQFTAGFDKNKTYTFLRVGSDERKTFKLADQSPYFNMAGLYYRGLPPSLIGGGE